MKGEIVSYEEAVNRCCSVLPSDLMAEILQRLPVKSLLRFESVSKDWLSLILCPQFIAKHLLHHRQKVNYLHCYRHVPHCSNDISRVMLAHYSANNTDCCPKGHHQRGISLISKVDNNNNDDQNDNPFATSVLSLDYRIRKNNVSIVGSSDGLVCFKFQNDQSFGIWNPATRKLKFLPSLSLDYNSTFRTCSFGFSYVLGNSCYKLVRISEVNQANNNGGYVTRAQVLNLGQDCWREVFESSHELLFYVYKPPVVVNGCLHWFGSTLEERSMIWFDMEKEIFVKKTMVSYPDEGFNFSKTRCKLTVFEENLAMFVSPITDDWFICDEDEESEAYHQIWIYEKANHAWKKKLTFGPLPTGHYPVGLWGDREIIIKQNDLVTYKLDSDQIHTYGLNAYLYNFYSKQKINYPPCREIYCNLDFYSYVQSLLQI